jgi:transposase
MSCECEYCRTKPNYQGIALNNARVIEDFDKVLQKRNNEINFLIEVIHKLEANGAAENFLNSNETLKLGRIEKRVERKMTKTNAGSRG